MTRTVLALGLTLSWIGAWGCQGKSSGDSSVAGFIDYYSDSSMWCEHQVDCEQTKDEVCRNGWPSRKDTETALEIAELSRDELAKCKTSSLAYDECYLSASCEEIAVAGAAGACEAELDRFSRDCAGLLDAFTMVNIGAEPDGGVDGPSMPSSENIAIAEEICDRSTACSGQPVHEARDGCIEAVSMAFESIPDPPGVLACIQGMSCDSLANDGTTQCVDIDPDATTCLDEDKLDLCNGDGVCREQDCTRLCTMQGLMSLGCSFSEPDGYDKCMCGLQPP